MQRDIISIAGGYHQQCEGGIQDNGATSLVLQQLLSFAGMGERRLRFTIYICIRHAEGTASKPVL